LLDVQKEETLAS